MMQKSVVYFPYRISFCLVSFSRSSLTHSLTQSRAAAQAHRTTPKKIHSVTRSPINFFSLSSLRSFSNSYVHSFIWIPCMPKWQYTHPIQRHHGKKNGVTFARIIDFISLTALPLYRLCLIRKLLRCSIQIVTSETMAFSHTSRNA